jgi:hypothetical protein
MRIGIITQPLTTNYGGILQNYALQEVLRRMGHEPWTVDYGKMSWLTWLDCAWRVVAHKLLGHNATFPSTPPQVKQKQAPLRQFVDNNINLTRLRTWYIQSSVIKKYHFQALIAGSDQVWRPRYNAKLGRCFFDFASGWDVRRIAYAASFGTDEWEFTEDQTRVCSALAKKFSGISVRELPGVELCRKYLGVDAAHVLDPTLLLKQEDYCKLCEQIPIREAFVFAYILDESPAKIEAIRTFAKRKGLPYFIKSAGPNVQPDDTVELWLSYFRDAAFVITDSFHGTAFSINFNKDFYVYGNAHRGNSRFESLLRLFGLEERMIESLPENEEAINWSEVNRKLEAERDNSMRWLTGAIGGSF